MTLKINDSGTWKEPTKVSVKDGGAWKEVLTASVKDGGSWKPFYQRKYTYTVSSNVNKLDLDTVLTSDQKLGDVDVVINSGVYVYSDSTGTPALLTGNGVAGVLTIINNGYIYGAGGAGGSGGSPDGGAGSGGSGGTALKLEKNITLESHCEHHMAPIIGKAHVAYIPKERVVGLSKLARVVEVFSKRLQTQERLTMQVAKTLMESLDAKGVAVTIDSTHQCMTMRGIKKEQASTVTNYYLGQFKEDLSFQNRYLRFISIAKD